MLLLRNIFLKTLRDHRWGTLLWGVGLGAIISMDVWLYPEYSTSSEKLADLQRAYEAFGFLTGEVVPVDTLGGFLTVESFGYIGVMLGIWLAVVGVGLFRGEEEQGALELLMSTPRSRVEVFAAKAAGMAVAGLGAVTVFGGVLFGVVAATNQSLPFWGTLGALLNTYLMAMFWGAAGVLAGQVIPLRRTASLVTGGLLLGTYLLNSVAEIVGGLEWLTWLLPAHYYSLTKSLVPGRAVDPLGIGVLAAGTTALLMAAGYMFVRRDVGGRFALWPEARYTGAAEERTRRLGSPALLGSVFGKSLRDQFGSMLGWGLGLAALGAVIVGTAEEALEPLFKTFASFPLFEQFMGDAVSVEAYLSLVLFLYLPVLVIVYALTQVWGWASDEEEGRLELLVAEPVPRWAALLGRYAASAVTLAGVLAMAAGGMLLTAQLTGLDLDYGRVVGAVAAIAAPTLVVLAFGLALATWMPRPGVAVGITAAVVVAMYFVDMMSQLFDWPAFVQHLTVFHYYGRP
ncbi:MAG TPA: ABC transporter permease subunit, partial [Chloroflexia bacterium]|nr:ABC transporter permease subunit [Chloroflexia bacterium]